MKDNTINILSLFIFVSILSCENNKHELSEDEVTISEELKEKFEHSEELVYSNDTLLASEEVLTYYKDTDFNPIWITKSTLNDRGQELFEFIGDARNHGLIPEMFHYKMIKKTKDSSILDAEMMLSNAFMLFITHINVGCIDTSDYSYRWKKELIDFDISEELKQVTAGSSAVDVIESHQPDFWEYAQLHNGLTLFLKNYALDSNHYDIPAFKDDSTSCYIATHEALIGHSFLDSTVSNQDSMFIHQLKLFQKTNGLLDDGIVGKWTSKALNKSNQDRFYSAALSLEKWRWKKVYPEKYIRINIPEFTLYFVKNKQAIRKHRVIVGAYITQTPEFQATLKTMVTNPFWHVPYSIASTEILYAVRKDSSYFSKKGFKLFKNGNRVSPNDVDWSNVKRNNFGYRVRQDGGGGNSLGKIKFLFPNRHSVYLHDTPSKRLFKNDIRAYSHGCIRLHQPFDLAKEILLQDNHKIKGDTLDRLIIRGNQRVLELADPFEVYIEYFTATADSSGNVIFHPDIYGRDEKFIKHTFKKFNESTQP